MRNMKPSREGIIQEAHTLDNTKHSGKAIVYCIDFICCNEMWTFIDCGMCCENTRFVRTLHVFCNLQRTLWNFSIRADQ